MGYARNRYDQKLDEMVSNVSRLVLGRHIPA
jgi:hypothetical protein